VALQLPYSERYRRQVVVRFPRPKRSTLSADSGGQPCNPKIGQLTNIEPLPLPLPYRAVDPDGEEAARWVVLPGVLQADRADSL
jgi:hypothetical protein